MLIELFLFFEFIMVCFFLAAFFSHQEILWVISLVLSGILMFVSWNVEVYVYNFNQTLNAYYPIIVNHSYPYMMAINMIFFTVSLLLCLFDIFDKYGGEISHNVRDPKRPNSDLV